MNQEQQSKNAPTHDKGNRGRPKLKLKVSKMRREQKGQQRMFNAYGDAYFNFQTDATEMTGTRELIVVAGMRLEVPRALGDAALATKIVLYALADFHRIRKAFRPRSFGAPYPVTFEGWEVQSCTVSVRRTGKDSVVRTQYSSTANSLELSLPHSTSWGINGLLWLATYENCCDKNRAHPTPWLAKPCTCVLDYF